MSIPKKGSRTVDVGNKTYNYLIRTNSGELFLTIQESVKNPGRPVQIPLNNIYITVPGTFGVGPGDVRKIIQTLITDGWDPSSKKHNYVTHRMFDITR